MSACLAAGATITKKSHEDLRADRSVSLGPEAPSNLIGAPNKDANVGSDAIESRCSDPFRWGIEMKSTQTRSDASGPPAAAATARTADCIAVQWTFAGSGDANASHWWLKKTKTRPSRFAAAPSAIAS